MDKVINLKDKAEMLTNVARAVNEIEGFKPTCRESLKIKRIIYHVTDLYQPVFIQRHCLDKSMRLYVIQW